MRTISLIKTVLLGIVVFVAVGFLVNGYASETIESDEFGVLWDEKGVAVCTAPYSQVDRQLISLGNGNTMIVWNDNRSSSGCFRDDRYDIYAQCIDIEGNVLWEENGVPICTASGNQYIGGGGNGIVPDGIGGAIVVWEDARDDSIDEIYAQRITTEGKVLWEPNGICVSNNKETDLVEFKIIKDTKGGFIVVWESYPNNIEASQDDGHDHLFAQRVDSNGNLLWGNNGIVISCNKRWLRDLKIVSDDKGGTFICWEEIINYEESTEIIGIYFQYIDAQGNILWDKDGILISEITKYIDILGITFCGDNTVSIIYKTNDNTYCKRIDINGSLKWETNLFYNGCVNDLVMISDKQGDLFIAWVFTDSAKYNDKGDIYMQKISNQGSLLWGDYGIPICVEQNRQQLPRLFNNNENSIMIAWDDNREGCDDWLNVIDKYTLYIQCLDKTGEILWEENGKKMHPCRWAQIASDINGDLIIAYAEDTDKKDSDYSDIYAQRIGELKKIEETVDEEMEEEKIDTEIDDTSKEDEEEGSEEYTEEAINSGIKEADTVKCIEGNDNLSLENELDTDLSYLTYYCLFVNSYSSIGKSLKDSWFLDPESLNKYITIDNPNAKDVFCVISLIDQAGKKVEAYDVIVPAFCKYLVNIHGYLNETTKEIQLESSNGVYIEII